MKMLFSTKTRFSEFHLLQCVSCTLTRTIPFPDDEILRLHDTSAYYGKNENKFIPIIQRIRNEIMRTYVRYYLSMISYSGQKLKILDVGCAEGRLLKAFLEFGCECWGVEHHAYPPDRFQNADQIRYLQGEVEELKLPEGAFDLIFLWHTLEHMGDPQRVMARLHELLAPEGTLIVAVPNFSSMEARRFKEFWFHLDVPWHKYHFNERSIRHLMRRNNYRMNRMTTRCLEQGPFGLLQSVLNAMGWRHNEFYEALKGNLSSGINMSLAIQFLMGIFLVVPTFLVSVWTSTMGKGPVLKVILKK
jgi:SAM-dependent methyltransferase